MNNSPTIGFVGTGIMGSHMARRLASAGFCVNAWNRSAEKLGPLGAHGVRAAASPAAALAGVDTAIVMLSTAAVIEAVLFRHGTDGRAPIGSLATGSTLIVMSSIPIDEARRQAAALAERGVQYLDAPVSGGEPGARDGTLAIMVGGHASVLDAAMPILSVLGKPTHLGTVGSGQLAKLANQVIVGGTLVAIAEALELARRGGADPAAVREALMGGFGDSKVLRVLGERMVRADFAPGSPASYQLKDMKAAAAFAGDLGFRLGLLDAVIEMFECLEANGEGMRDVAIIAREVARRAALPRA